MEIKRVMAKMVQEERAKLPTEEIDFDHIPSFINPAFLDSIAQSTMPIPFQLRYFNRHEVARMFDVDVTTVNRWAKKGYILAHRPSYHVTYYRGYELLRVDRFVNIVAK